MRETPNSLRAYFILVGIFSLIGGCAGIYAAMENGGDPLVIGVVVAYTGVGAVYLWIGAKLKTLLRDKPQIPVRFATLAILISLFGRNILGILFNVYIWYQLKRMAKEATPEMESQVLE